MIDFSTKHYLKDEVASFRKNKDKYGRLSNMFGVQLRVNDIAIRTSEALYQACKVPTRPDIQQEIISQRSPMTAARIGRSCPDIRPDWDEQKVSIMYWCLQVKAIQDISFADMLAETENKDIVEDSYRDSYWGAKPQGDLLVGQNVLGQLLMMVREELIDGKLPSLLQPIKIPDFKLYGEPIEPVSSMGTLLYYNGFFSGGV